MAQASCVRGEGLGRPQSGLRYGCCSEQGTGAQVTENGKLRCGSGGAATVRLLQGL